MDLVHVVCGGGQTPGRSPLKGQVLFQHFASVDLDWSLFQYEHLSELFLGPFCSLGGSMGHDLNVEGVSCKTEDVLSCDATWKDDRRNLLGVEIRTRRI